MTDWSESAFVWANELAGRSFTVDALLDLAAGNPIAKAGPVIACFAYAWWSAGDEAAQNRRRRILAVTLLSVFLIAPVMKAVSTDGFAPRPLVRSEQVYILDGAGDLLPLSRTKYRVPATGDAAQRYEKLQSGEIESNDFNSFPSDHAALFLALAFGIFLASKGAGVLALAWTVVCTLGVRVITGMHWPFDIVAGGAIGIGFLLAFLAIARLLPRRVSDLPVEAARRWPGLAAAVIVVALAEVANAMNTLERLAELAASAAGVGS